MSEMNPKVILGFIIVAVVGFYVAAALLPDAIITYYDGVNSLSANSNVSAWMVTLMAIAPIGVPIGLLAIFIFAGMKYLGKD